MDLPKTNLEVVKAICQSHGICRLALFGSFASGTNHPESDVDLLVEFSPGRTPGLFKLVAIAEELSPHFGGRKIDLRTPQDLSPYFREQVINGSQELYAA